VKPPSKGRFVFDGLASGRVVVVALHAIQLGNAGSLTFPDAMGDAVFLVFPAAELTFDLDVSATLERSGKFSELGPANDTVPLGPGFPIAGVFAEKSPEAEPNTGVKKISTHGKSISLRVVSLRCALNPPSSFRLLMPYVGLYRIVTQRQFVGFAMPHLLAGRSPRNH
jgi:hypothetical protein